MVWEKMRKSSGALIQCGWRLLFSHQRQQLQEGDKISLSSLSRIYHHRKSLNFLQTRVCVCVCVCVCALMYSYKTFRFIFAKFPQKFKMKKTTNNLAPYNPTPKEVVDIAIKMLNIQDDDVVYDVGCGKGAFLVEAAKQVKSYSLRLSSIENAFNPYTNLCKENVQKYHLEDRVHVVKADATKYDFSDATAMFLYLVPNGLRAIYSDLEKRLKDGCRIISYRFQYRILNPSRKFRQPKLD